MKPRPFGIVAAGAVVALLVTVFLLRSPEQAEQSLTPPTPIAAVSHLARLNEHARQRLMQLRAARSGDASGAPQHVASSATAAVAAMAAATPVAQIPEPGIVTPTRAAPTPLSWASFPSDISLLSKIALEDTDPDRRMVAVSLLSGSDNPQVIPILVQALSDANEDVRMAAVESLEDFTGETPVDAIESALNDPSADIRFEALSVLGDVGGERARNAVQRALNDPDPDVRALAEEIVDTQP